MGPSPTRAAPADNDDAADVPPILPYEKIVADLENLPDESQAPHPFSIYDVFFWRDAPDWYHKTFLSAGFGLSYCTLKQYMNRHELEVFLPPRAKVLPENMRRGYRNTQMFKQGLWRVGRETTTIAGAAAVYYGGAYYLGEYRGAHSWENFAASGALAGVGLSLYLIYPWKPRTGVFGALLGAALGSFSGLVTEAAGIPHWDESKDWEGWWLGKYIDKKKKAPSEQADQSGGAAAAAAVLAATEAAQAEQAQSGKQAQPAASSWGWGWGRSKKE
uniref:Uncharacterized protein n=1 Tax=Chlamydomonas leiostraca TaxID=1034604 RepID=A0A7S0WVP0_9CHLO|mmetsp:Transcript_30671/g.78350  ORF Transcript_30671/g.78350 Transcript_30671/m.78350 type:complete len:274 (+) Transcript_30671:47-868(+)